MNYATPERLSDFFNITLSRFILGLIYDTWIEQVMGLKIKNDLIWGEMLAVYYILKFKSWDIFGNFSFFFLCLTQYPI